MLATKHYARSEKGVTIIEVVIVMSIMAILSLVTLGIITSLFDSSIRTGKYLDQNTTIETYYGFMASRLSTTQVGDVGVATTGNTSTINPLSVAGDQVYFKSNVSGTFGSTVNCYRIFYVKSGENSNGLTAGWMNSMYTNKGNSIWAAVGSTDTDCEALKPKAGPNQTNAPASYDPILNPPNGTPMPVTPFVLASKISSSPKSSGNSGPEQCNGGTAQTDSTKIYQDPLIPFVYCNTNLSPWTIGNTGIMRTADSNNLTAYQSNSFYSNISNLDNVVGIQAIAYVDAGAAPTIPVRQYAQTFSLGQVQLGCELTGGNGDPNIDVSEVVAALNDADTNWHNVDGSNSLGVTFQNGWGNYPGWGTASFYKDKMDVVHLKGLVRNGTLDSTVFILPAEYRPTQNEIFMVFNDSGKIGRLDIYTDGVVFLHNFNSISTGFVSLAGITFRTR